MTIKRRALTATVMVWVQQLRIFHQSKKEDPLINLKILKRKKPNFQLFTRMIKKTARKIQIIEAIRNFRRKVSRRCYVELRKIALR